MILARYPTDLTNTQWAVLAPLIPAAKAGGRTRSTDMRQVVNAIFYVLRGGCQWRLLPKDFAASDGLRLLSKLAVLGGVGTQE
jgi:putative transposase